MKETGLSVIGAVHEEGVCNGRFYSSGSAVNAVTCKQGRCPLFSVGQTGVGVPLDLNPLGLPSDGVTWWSSSGLISLYLLGAHWT